MHRTIVILIGAVMLCIGGACSSSDSSTVALGTPSGSAGLETERASYVADIPAVLAAEGLEILESVECDGDMGYRARDDNDKPYLLLQGTSYNMGYQMGALRPEGVWMLGKVYPFRLIGDMLGIAVDDLPPALVDFIFNEVMTLCRNALEVIPDELEAEMQGVADGATSRGWEVGFEDVLLINEGFDAIYAILFTGTIPSMQGLRDLLESLHAENPQLDDYIRFEGSRVLFPRGDPGALGCNEFVVSSQATPDGTVYHGRDFMFPTGDIIQDTACMGIYLPDEGLPFVCVTAPGFVGQTTALNAEGLSMGMDVVRAGCTRSDPGMSCLLVLRDLVQHCGTLEGAIERLRGLDRGVSWLYILGDDEFSEEHTHGVVVEEGMRTPSFEGPDLLPLWQQWLLGAYIGRLDEGPLPQDGLMLRNQEWIYPTQFLGLGITIPTPEDECVLGIQFPGQIETWPDVVMATNHYIIPRMVFTAYTPWMHLVDGPGSVTRSRVRYELLFERLAAEYGSIDFDTARDLIDFLNPNSVYGDTGYYEPAGQIEGPSASWMA